MYTETQHVSASAGTVRSRKRPVKTLNSAHPVINLLKVETTALRKFCQAFPTPRTLMIELLVRHQEWDQLVSLEIDSKHYLSTDSSTFRSDYQATAMLSKSPTLPTTYDRREEAIKDFFAAEMQCAETNDRLDSYADSALMPMTLDVHRAIHFAREYILGVLGNRPSRADLKYAEESMRFGPGSTTSLSGVVTSGAKYGTRVLDVTPRLADFGVWCLPYLWRHQRVGLNLRPTSKFATVSKNAKKDRGICIEPDLNVYVQLGTGALLRSKLRSSGLNLDYAAEWNRYLASVAYDWRLTTLDLKAASDTVSRSAVWLLLPETWAQLLFLSRVDKTRVAIDREVDLHKWSSMGNGYTFELETLIFWGVLQGCLKVMGETDKQSACFGDDLIFPSSCTTLVMSTLNFLGFSVNEKKTFSTGLFRESCGSDYFNGEPCRPVYFKGLKDETDEEITTVQACYHYANAIRGWSHSIHHGNPSCDARVLPTWLSIFTSVTERLRYRVPFGASDNGFAGNWDECTSTTQVRAPTGERASWGGTYYREFFRPMILDKAHPYGSYLATLAAQAVEASGGQPMRGRFKTATTRWAYTLVWPSLGPWR